LLESSFPALLARMSSERRFSLNESPVQVKYQDKSAVARFANRKFFVSNVQSLPFESNSFDLILSLETLEHVGYPERAL
jgi:2-polyprenyl-3-methyl-5-hydroxy-6-metoxy-1,4-benzoquinol methylase